MHRGCVLLVPIYPTTQPNKTTTELVKEKFKSFAQFNDYFLFMDLTVTE